MAEVTYRSGATCSCGHDVIDHDGVGCDERDCGCSTPVDELLEPTAEPEAPGPPIEQNAVVPLVWCAPCGIWAMPHVHGTAYV